MTGGINSPNLPTGTLIELIGHSDAGGGNKNTARQDLASFIAANITPSLVAGPFGVIADFLATGTVTSSYNNKMLVLPAGSQITATLDIPGNLPSDFQVKLWNPPYDSSGTANLRRHRIIAQYEDFYLSPGQVAYFTKHGGYVVRTDPPVKWLKQSLIMYANSAATQTYFDGMVAGTGSAKQSITACVQTILRDIDHQGSNPKIVPVGTFLESITQSGSIGAGTLIYYEPASPATCTWKNGANPFCLQVANGATAILHNLDFARVTLSNVVFISEHQKGVVDVGDPNISTTTTGITFTDAGPSGSCMVADGAGNTLNINAAFVINAGSYGTIVSLGGASSGNMAGGTSGAHIGNVINGTPTIGTFMQLAGSGANMAMGSFIDFTGAVAAGCTKATVSLNASLSLSGNTLPGSVAISATLGGQFV